jgi:hypothetical protein
MVTGIRKAVNRLLKRDEAEREIDDEMRFHLEMEIEKNRARGLSPDDARRNALQSFGGVEKFKDEVRDESFARFFETVWQDLRYGIRGLRKNLAFSAAAVVTLALGIGANTAIFSVVNGVLLQSLPYGGGERLVRIRQDAPSANIEDSGFSPPDFGDYRTQTSSFEGFSENGTARQPFAATRWISAAIRSASQMGTMASGMNRPGYVPHHSSMCQLL